MSGSDDKSPHTRNKITEKPSEDLTVSTPCSYGGARPKVYPEKKENKSPHRRSKTDEPSCSYGGARPKVYSEIKKDETEKSSNVERALEKLESAVRRQEKLVRRRREEVEKDKSVSEHLDPGRYHTEQQLQDARLHMEELQVTEEQFFENYLKACKNRKEEEGYSCETSDLVNRILNLLDSIDEITTAMLYIIEDDQETYPSSSTEHSDNRRGSDIYEDYASKSEEKTPTFFHETMKDRVTFDNINRLNLEDRPPSVLPSSMSSTPPSQ
ncbi:uncharacterized protein TNCT_365081 [Trichonephila clavata]|uniref:Uncharacterized protein n=1 Tax=Trichonephila clavata TaxID=2740835 RepID=A0A8X6KDC7_TRICU|nr:uncharacterized protein TNCT_365081 [Trichonephila clavata]